MNILPVCVIYTQDSELVRRISGHLHLLAAVRPVTQPAQLETVLHQFTRVILLADLRGEEIGALLPRILKSRPHCLVVALGTPGSDPMRNVGELDLYDADTLDIDRARLQALIHRCDEHLRLQQENQALKQDAAKGLPSAPAPSAQPVTRDTIPLPLHHFSRAFRNFENVETMLENIIEGVAGCAKVSRVGVFCIDHNGKTYRLRAGIKCLEDARELEVPAGAPLVSWMQLNAHLISRATLEHIPDPSTHMLLEQALDTLGAEVIIPLHGRDRINGWIFFGHRVTGIPFSHADLEDLTLLAEHVSLTLENALLYRGATLQRTLAETVIDSMPVGIVAADEENRIFSVNREAAALFGVRPEDLLHQPAAQLDSRAASLLASRVLNEHTREPARWIEPRTKRSLSVITRQIVIRDRCAGAVAIVTDMSREDALREKQIEVERAAFWAELASAMSHAVRNPLVAISTFAQLLPQKYDDAEFRGEFSSLVGREIGRLNTMIDQLTAFASPGELDFKACPIDEILQAALKQAGTLAGADTRQVELSAEPNLPLVRADKRTLTECFAHLIANALEAVIRSSVPSVHVTAGETRTPNGNMLMVNVQDNGSGIPPGIREHMFSPFCTGKVCGIGLGLPIARRCVEDHGGELTVDTSAKGTNITVLIPVAPLASQPAAEQEKSASIS